MKKIMFALVLLMGVVFTQTASAATLNWSSLQAGATNTYDNDSVISAQYGFGAYTGAFSHNYSLTANPSVGVLAFVIELLNENILINHVTLDNVPMTWDVSESRWVGQSLSNASHSIHIDGIISKKAQQYQLNVSAVPVPAAIWLFGSGIAGLVGFSRRKTALAV
jgi:hypothetical protein